MSRYCVKIGFGVRRHGMATPEAGPCVPPYLHYDKFTRYVWVEAEDQIEAELVAFDMADTLSLESNFKIRREDPTGEQRVGFPGRIVVGSDMITSIKTVEAVL